jgi:DNA-binding Lrp family transcriptional regulator
MNAGDLGRFQVPEGGDAGLELRELKVLTEIERDPEVSQRTIAQRVGIALGLTNTILRRLVRKGLVTTRALPANRLAYHLTAQGIADKTRLFIDYVRVTTNYFCIVRNVFKDKLAAVRSERGVQTVAIVTINELADMVYLATKEVGLDLVGVYDTARAGTSWLGIKVQPADAAIEADAIVVMDLAGGSAEAWKPAREGTVVIRIGDVLAADYRRFAQGFE